ncbi:hypothetical protein F511_34697 [Dorcoceras hygrometricum]|uniref:Uncharacterized protein n=1 Tax=Dorcoceras hygrometricum TaxID=472368 RepID=A0A2Z7D202_9LAMI|nr:hypothetical protein F511_34697 [Dorcoceras hygrometricum]
MKIEFRLLNDILAKAITAKAGSFDAVTQERFLLMAAIHCGININWSRFLFDILKEMEETEEEYTDSEDTVPLNKVLKPTEKSLSDEDSMTIDDILKHIPEDMLPPSLSAEEPTKILFNQGVKFREHCDVLSMQIDSDLVIYRTTLVRTFQVVTICRVDKSEVLVVLISPHDSKRH